LSKKQTISGLFWTFADSFLLRGISFIGTLVIARILGPTEFGIIGMISIFIAIGTSLVDSGMSSSIIRTQNADDNDYSTVFYLNLFISFTVFIILFILAPYIAGFYSQPILTNVIRLYCLSFVISAFSSIQIAILDKEMQFRKMMLYNIPGVIIGVILGISLGYLGYGVWSIVWMYLSIQLIQSIVLWIFSKWKPSRTFSKEKMKYHYSFGYKLMLSSLIDIVFKNIYNILIGKYFSVKSLGFYERANTFNEYPVSILTNIISRVSYPLMANMQMDKQKLAIVYKQILQFTFFITAPLMFGAAAIAKPLFLLVLGEQWLPAVPFFQIISLGSILYPIHAFNINILKVSGRSDLFLKLEIVKKLILVITIVIAFQYGVYGLVWSTVLTSFLSLIINTYHSSSIINYTTKKQLLDMLPTFSLSVFVFIVMTYFLSFLETFSIYLQIIFPAIAGFIVYLFFSYLIRSKPLLFAIKLIKERNT
jgi:O-antigen/teichoic acid export membrane protein